MTCHSAIVHHGGAGDDGGTVRFDGDRWLRYVPLRLPWTQLVQERLPAGAAGVLLNRSHPHPDLILVLSPEDKRLFEGIDGRRSIAEIADCAARTERARARTFFEKLWWYDQVVFDATNVPTTIKTPSRSAPPCDFSEGKDGRTP
jgi:hypothetical protein